MRRVGFVGWAVLLIGLAGCDVGQPAPEPTIVLLPPTLTPLVITATPQTPVSTSTRPGPVAPSSTPALLPNTPSTPRLLPTSDNLGILPSLTPSMTSTHTATLFPSVTPLVLPTNPPPPTATSPIVTATPRAEVCTTCGGLRLRDAPGDTGDVVTMLAGNTPLNVIGRTADNAWVQVIIPDGTIGWVAAQFVTFNVDISLVNVSGVVVLPTATSTSQPVVVAQVPQHDVSLDLINVVTGITSRSRQIFLDGQARGNLPNVFSQVGDSITVADQFLNQIGSGNYNLGAYSQYSGVISYFSGPTGLGRNPFDPTHLAAGNGWSTFDVLDPDFANGAVCQPGESPLHCEYRVVRPSVALIMLGTNDAGGVTTADYTANLRRIVDISIEMGVIPVLSTLPPRLAGAASPTIIDQYNQIIVSTARSYDLPLWNYWQALQGLPNQGLSSDGVHPSTPPDYFNAHFDDYHLQYGFPVRNLTALQVLDQLWRQVLYDGGQVASSSSAGNTTTTTDPVQSEPADASPAADGTAYSCPGALPPRLVVGQPGRVTPGLPNKIRSQPSLAAAEVGSAPGEATFTVVGGPTCADGFTWWQIDYNGTIGWTASGNSSEYWVEPIGG